MYWQNRYLKEQATFASLAGLETVELPKSGLLSGLEIRAWGSNAVDADKPDCWLHDRIKKFEVIVNGSQVVKQLDGRQLIADMLYKRTPQFSHDCKNMSGGSTEEFFYINFGRHYHDLDYMLDLAMVNDPELRMETDFALTGHDGFTNGKAMTAAPYFSIIPHILREPEVSPKGYLKTSEVYRFTSAASKKENMTIPRGPMYSNLYLQDFYNAHGISNDLEHLELNLDNDRLIPLRIGPHELETALPRLWGLFTLVQQFTVKGGQVYPHPLEEGRCDGLIGGTSDAEIARFDLWGNVTGVQLRKTSDATAITTSHNATLNYHGILPFSVAAIPYFWPWDERFWIDSSKLGDFWLRVEETAGAVDSIVKLLADEVVTKYL